MAGGLSISGRVLRGGVLLDRAVGRGVRIRASKGASWTSSGPRCWHRERPPLNWPGRRRTRPTHSPRPVAHDRSTSRDDEFGPRARGDPASVAVPAGAADRFGPGTRRQVPGGDLGGRSRPTASKVAYVLAVPRKPMAEDDGPAWAELHVVGPDRKSRPFVTGEVNVSRRLLDPRRPVDPVPRQAGQGRAPVALPDRGRGGRGPAGPGLRVRHRRLSPQAGRPAGGLPRGRARAQGEGRPQEEGVQPDPLRGGAEAGPGLAGDARRPGAAPADQAPRLGLRAASQPGRRAARRRPGPDARASTTPSPAGRSTSPWPGPAA